MYWNNLKPLIKLCSKLFCCFQQKCFKNYIYIFLSLVEIQKTPTGDKYFTGQFQYRFSTILGDSHITSRHLLQYPLFYNNHIVFLQIVNYI